MNLVIQNVVSAASLGATYALLALGVAVVFGIMGLINFAWGELIMAGAYTMVLYSLGVPWSVVVVTVVVVVVVLAVVMERLAFRPVRGADPTTLLITSFALSFMLQNVGLIAFGALAKPVAMPDWVLTSVYIGSVQISVVNIVTVALAVVLLGSLVAFLRRTGLGVEMRAAAEDFEMARLVGVKANRVVATAFAISGILAAAAALALTMQSGVVTADVGVRPVLIAFVATVIGGLGTLAGAAAGGFLLGAITVTLQATLPLSLRPFLDAFIFTSVVVVLLIRPQGIIPRLSEVRV